VVRVDKWEIVWIEDVKRAGVLHLGTWVFMGNENLEGCMIDE
jgi:hypothetical protein